MTREVAVFPDPNAVAQATADQVVAAIRNAIRRRGVCRLVLSGGATPLLVYPLLLSAPRLAAVDWSAVEFFWADERAVPPTHLDSNYNAAIGTFLSDLPGVRLSAIHRMEAERDDLEAAATDYQAVIADCFEIAPGGPAIPRFDLVWLGMGRDGHTASLFPGSPALLEQRRWVVANWIGGPAGWRMTLTYPILNAARQALFQVCGPDKREAFGASLDGGTPASRVHARRTSWLVDREAAR